MFRGKTSLILALLLGLAAGAVAFGAVQRKQREIQSGWTLVPVVVAAQDVAEGTVLTRELIARRSVPEQFVTRSVVKPESADYLLGQRVLAPLQAGDMLLWSHLETARSTERLSHVVQKRGRAFALDVSGSRTTVGGWIRPNDHVDVIGSFRDPGTGEQVAVTLMQNVVVLATGRITGTTNASALPESERRFDTVTLLVLPEEAEALALALDLGSLTLTLRHPDDLELQDERARATVSTLLTGERMRSLQRLRQRTIQVIRGTELREAFQSVPAPP